jgi:hypothetical protein
MSSKGSIRKGDFEPAVEAWMKTHTVGDLRNLALNLECKGQNAADVREVVDALTQIENGELPRMGGN